MSKNRSICRRCHRIRTVDEARYCAGCASALRALEAPKQPLTTFAPTTDEEETITHFANRAGEIVATIGPSSELSGIEAGAVIDGSAMSFAAIAEDEAAKEIADERPTIPSPSSDVDHLYFEASSRT